MRSQWNKLCLSLMPRTADELFAAIATAQYADILEIRLDICGIIDVNALRKFWDKPIIAACRRECDGGMWRGGERERLGVFEAAQASGVDYIDLEYDVYDELRGVLRPGPAQLIISRHSATRDADTLVDEARALLDHKADVYKFVFEAHNVNDHRLAGAIRQIFSERSLHAVVHAGGALGAVSRMLGALEGNAWTYTALESGAATAAGQPTLRQCLEVFRLGAKSSRTALLGLVGHPVAQSSGWKYHNRAFAEHRRDALYLNFDVTDITTFWRYWRERLTGISVTLPHKEAATALCDRPAPEVERTGICNTMIRDGVLWRGYNTDYIALRTLLASHIERLRNGVAVYGSGATTASALAALQDLGVHNATVWSRNRERGAQLAKRFDARFTANPQNDGMELGAILQTTPVGMAPGSEELSPAAAALQAGMLAFDAVYNPTRTRFLLEAERCGCVTISGERMFELQAREQSALFLNASPEIEVGDTTYANR